jgi:teichuronic acid biosynthesis glycosyltransferase TuaG
MSKISIVMPAYNSALYIEESIKSVLAQTYADWELIIVDDGSTDNTEKIVQSYIVSHQNIFYYKQANKGQAISRNKGIELSTGHLMAFLDSDDLWLPHTLETLYSTIQKEKVDFVFCSFYRLINGQMQEETINTFPLGKLDGWQMKSILSLYNPLVIHGMLTFRQHIVDVGGFELNPKLLNCSEDYNLWIKIALQGKTFFGLPERLAIYRMHEAGTHQNTIKMLEAEIFVHRNYLRIDSEGLSVAKRLLRFKYRRLISAYLDRNEKERAIAIFGELLDFDKNGITGKCILALSKILPFTLAHKCGVKFLYPLEYRIMDIFKGKWNTVLVNYKNSIVKSK